MTCAQSTNIHVAVRVRPFNRRETASGAERVIFFETGEHDNVNAHEGIAVIKNPNFSAAGEAVSAPVPAVRACCLALTHRPACSTRRLILF